MKKATSKEYLDTLSDFKLNNNINDPNFDYYAALKFCKSTFLKDFYNVSLIKTNSDTNPVLFQQDNKYFIYKDFNSLFTSLDKLEVQDYVPVLKDLDRENIQKMHDLLNESTSFKSFLAKFTTVFGDIDSEYTEGVSRSLNVFKFAETLQHIEEKLNKPGITEQSIRFHLEHMIEHLSAEIFVGKELSVFKLINDFRQSNGDENNAFSDVMEDYYEQLDNYFDLFKFQQVLKNGLMLNANTEEELINTPELVQFIDQIKQQHPDWFQSFDASLTHLVTDDNAIRASGVALSESTADFDLLNPKSFMATAYPSYVDGYSHLSRRFQEETDSNFVHIYGDNSFFKVYYHHLTVVEKDNRMFCHGIDSDIAYSIPTDKKIDYILPVLDYLEKNKIILELSRESTILHTIKKDELLKIISEQYPNLVALDFDNNYKKAIKILDTHSFEEAFAIHKSSDEVVEVKPSKIKNGM